MIFWNEYRVYRCFLHYLTGLSVVSMIYWLALKAQPPIPFRNINLHKITENNHLLERLIYRQTISFSLIQPHSIGQGKP
ncbi:hypothetical protein MARHY1647 [Marinobacter nauticus ATCC 49840]|nr:hypothetical protein MARHY1647 [Marinobacter nauticus ATCC 49840]